MYLSTLHLRPHICFWVARLLSAADKIPGLTIAGYSRREQVRSRAHPVQLYLLIKGNHGMEK